MTTIVSYSDFRRNLSDYIDFVNKKEGVVKIRDEKRGKIIAQLITPKKEEFDWDSYMKFLDGFEPIFTDNDIEKIKRQRGMGLERRKRLNW